MSWFYLYIRKVEWANRSTLFLCRLTDCDISFIYWVKHYLKGFQRAYYPCVDSAGLLPETNCKMWAPIYWVRIIAMFWHLELRMKIGCETVTELRLYLYASCERSRKEIWAVQLLDFCFCPWGILWFSFGLYVYLWRSALYVEMPRDICVAWQLKVFWVLVSKSLTL